MNSFTAETAGAIVRMRWWATATELMDAMGAARFQECLRTLETQEEWQGALRFGAATGCSAGSRWRSRRMQLPGERTFVLNHGMDVTDSTRPKRRFTGDAAAGVDSGVQWPTGSMDRP